MLTVTLAGGYLCCHSHYFFYLVEFLLMLVSHLWLLEGGTYWTHTVLGLLGSFQVRGVTNLLFCQAFSHSREEVIE